MTALAFLEKSPDCILVLQGCKPEKEVFSYFPESIIIATDGAAIELLNLGVIPNTVIGDMDSINPELLKDTQCEIIKDMGQENNDFEKALIHILQKGFSEILIMGIHGGDFEHSLNNVSVLWKYVERFSIITIVDSLQRIAIPVFFSFSWNTCVPGEIISLIPFPHAKLSTQGFEWELEKEVLELSVREGARNKAKNQDLHIDLLEGRFLFFCDSRFPRLPQFTHNPS